MWMLLFMAIFERLALNLLSVDYWGRFEQKINCSIFDKSITPCGMIVWMLPLIFFQDGSQAKI